MRFLRFIMSGAAGFIGSQLCDRLIAEGHTVIGLDKLITGSRRNMDHLIGPPRCEFREGDVTKPFEIEDAIEGSLHFASLASPKDCLEHLIETPESGSSALMGAVKSAPGLFDCESSYSLTSASRTTGGLLWGS